MTRRSFAAAITAAFIAVSLTPLTAQVGGPGSTIPPRLTAEEHERLSALEPQRTEIAARALETEQRRAQVSNGISFRHRVSVTDVIGQLHARFQQTFHNLRIWGSEVAIHLDRNDTYTGHSGNLFRDIPVSTRPQLTESAAVDAATLDFLPRDWRGDQPTATTELVVYPHLVMTPTRGFPPPGAGAGVTPNAADYRQEVQNIFLAYHIRLEAAELEAMNYMVDAMTGRVLQKWQAELSDYSSVTGIGRSQFYGDVPIKTGYDATAGAKPYRMVDPSRNGNIVNDMGNVPASASWKGQNYDNGANAWGDGNDFDVTIHSTQSITGQTNAADVAHGMAAVWDMLRWVFLRNGLDGKKTPMIGRVHARKKADVPYGDAHWNGEAAHFGDGAKPESKPNASINTVGHEFGHGLWGFATDYSGPAPESAGLNEGHGDIMGALAATYLFDAGGTGSNLPEVMPSNRFAGRSRNPSSYVLDSIGGSGLSYYRPDMGDFEVHYQGCAYGHAFVFLVQGSVADPTSPLHSIYLPNGMSGIGPRKAGDIWQLATTGYLVGAPSFYSVRYAYLDAAAALFGKGSIEYRAVENAFGGINVGAIAPDFEKPTAFASLPIVNEMEGSLFLQATGSDDVGVYKIELLIDGAVVRTIAGSKFTGYLSLRGLDLGSHSVTARVYDYKLKTTIATRQFTLKGVDQLMQNGDFEAGAAGWNAVGGDIFKTDPAAAFLDSRYANFGASNVSITQRVKIPAGVTAATFSFRVNVNPEDATGSEKLFAEIVSTGGLLLRTVAVVAGTTNTDDTDKNYKQFSDSLTSLAGQTVDIRFRSSVATSDRFRVDQVSLTVTGNPSINWQALADHQEETLTVKMSSATFLDWGTVKRVEYTLNGAVWASQLTYPFLAVRSTEDLAAGNYQIRAVLYNYANGVILQTPAIVVTVKHLNQLIANSSFENGSSPWNLIGGAAIREDLGEGMVRESFLGKFHAKLGAAKNAVQRIAQIIEVPAGFTINNTLRYRVRINGDSDNVADDDRLAVRILNAQGELLDTLSTYPAYQFTKSAANWRGYEPGSLSLNKYRGRTIRVEFRYSSDGTGATSFLVDNVRAVTETFGVQN